MLANIPTHVVTGFLGAGKTTFIQHLLQLKPANETWAVLVNEFGEIGLDASLMGQSQGVVIREVAGGCLCCAAGVPLQVAINQLLTKAQPQRLIIEPTGLGHPQQILQALASKAFDGILALKQGCCLLDPRHLNDPRFTEHSTFNEQLASSNNWVFSKADCWQQQAQVHAAIDALKEQHPQVHSVTWSQQNSLPSAFIDRLMQPLVLTPAPQRGTSLLQPAAKTVATAPLAADGSLYRQHQQQGYYSYGWRFDGHWVFDFKALLAWVEQLDCQRLKAVMISDEGIVAINRLAQELKLSAVDDAFESRIELISAVAKDGAALDQGLRALRYVE